MDEKEPNKVGEAIVEAEEKIKDVLTQPVDKYLNRLLFRSYFIGLYLSYYLFN